MKSVFLSEDIKPVAGRVDFGLSAPGEPGFPRQFRWRGGTVEVAAILGRWKTTAPCTHGSGERYVDRHWYDIATAAGRGMRIYFDRRARPRSGRGTGRRWRVFSTEDDGALPPARAARRDAAAATGGTDHGH